MPNLTNTPSFVLAKAAKPATVAKPTVAAVTKPPTVAAPVKPVAAPAIQKGLVRALFVGINYDGIPELALKGCINDAMNTQILIQKFYPKCTQMRVITDRTSIKPTRANILAGLEWLTAGLVSGQHVYFHYSGHGGTIIDQSGDEKSGLDSCIYPYDGATLEGISDDELRVLLAEKIPAGSTCFAVLDSCNSGSALDLRYTWQCPSVGKLTFQQDFAYQKTKGNIIFLSGCKDDEVSLDLVNSAGTANGALTNALLYTWRTYKTGLKMKHLLWDVRKYMKDYGIQQTPQLSSGQALSSEAAIDLTK